MLRILNISSEGINVIGDGAYNSAATKRTLLYVTWAKYASNLTNVLRVEFISADVKLGAVRQTKIKEELTESEIKFTRGQLNKCNAIGIEAFPVYSRESGKGVVQIEGGKAFWSENTAVYMNAVIRWCIGCTFTFTANKRYVFFNVGPSIVNVAGVAIKTGEYVDYKGGVWGKIAFKDLKYVVASPTTTPAQKKESSGN